MPKAIDLATARALIQTRAELRRSGCSEREIERLVAAGVLRRVRNDRYVVAKDWEDLWNEGRHLVEVVSTHQLRGSSSGLLGTFGRGTARTASVPTCSKERSRGNTGLSARPHGRRGGLAQHSG